MVSSRVACLALILVAGGCDSSSTETPKGQVVATLNGEEITTRQLDLELAEFASGATGRSAEQAALRRILERRLLAQEARRQKLDQDPDFDLRLRRETDNLMGQAIQAKYVDQVAKVTPAEARTYVDQNPLMFGERRALVVDQIVITGAVAPTVLAQLTPLTTMEAVEALIVKLGLRYSRSVVTMDTSTLKQAVVQRILALPAGEVFLVPLPTGLLANTILEKRTVPLRGEQAVQIAMAMLQQHRIEEAVRLRTGSLFTAAAPTIRYNDRFKPSGPAPSQPAAR